MECFEKVKAAAPECMVFDEKPSVWFPVGGGWTISAKGVLKAEDAEALATDLKEKLMKQDVYLRVEVRK